MPLSTSDFDTILAMLDDADVAQAAALHAAMSRRLGQHAPPASAAPSRHIIGHFTFNHPRISPRYLNGQTVPVFKANDASWKADIPNEPSFRTWAGRTNVRIPKTLGTFVAVSA